jgi:PQQ-dependent catabolism-associated CXXCW motif protein
LRPEKALNNSHDEAACCWVFGLQLATDHIVDRARCDAHRDLIARAWRDDRMIKPAFVAVICLVTFAGSSVRSQESVPEPAGYRVDQYRAPTPATLTGAQVLTTAEAELHWNNHTIFVDVLALSPRPANLPNGTIWREKTRRDIPGSIWLPNTGYGELAAETENYFRLGLERVTQSDGAKLLVFYCLRECWMSWNAAKRALALGYKNVAWYPDGTDGWEAAGLPLQEAKPEPPSVQ